MAAPHGIRRLASLYGMMEQVRSLERRVAANSVDEAACAGVIQTAIRDSHATGGREALAAGNPELWSIAAKSREMAEDRIVRLAKVRMEREVALQQAVHVHRESRLKMEQMERLLERARVATATEDGRREQAVADDRFSSRLAWARGVEARNSE